MDAYQVLKTLEENGKRLEAYKAENEKMFKRIDRMFKKFFKG